MRCLSIGMFTSYSRCHGAPLKEPWYYGEVCMNSFREIAEMKNRLMPYIYEQSKSSAEAGHPMMRALIFEYPEAPTSWYIEDKYLFRNDLLIAPFMEEATTERDVCLPKGIGSTTRREKNAKAENVIGLR